uniref:Uncharacterized protein n=1 Tax=Plectus sambesii TaxID=2011161 RepID=A0A914X8A6_9BILA
MLGLSSMLLFICMFCLIDRASSQDPLVFQYVDQRNGRSLWIFKNTQYGPIPSRSEIRYRSNIRRPGYATVFGEWTLLSTVGSENFQLRFDRNAGMCADYEFRLVQDGRVMSTMYLLPPQPRLAPTPQNVNGRISLLRLQAERSSFSNDAIALSSGNQVVTADIQYTPELLYWTQQAGIRVNRVTPYVQLLRCKKLFDSYVPEPIIRNSGFSVDFRMEHATHDCAFRIGLIFRLQSTGADSWCELEYRTTEEDSLDLTISCAAVGLNCPERARTGVGRQGQSCEADCDPNVVGARRGDASASFSGGRPSEVLQFYWQFDQQFGSRTPAQYRIRYSTAVFTERNTIAYETDVKETTVNNYPNYYQIVPDSGTAQNYTFQICALRSPCSYGINWDAAPKFPMEFKSKFYRDPRISSALSFFPDAGER